MFAFTAIRWLPVGVLRVFTLGYQQEDLGKGPTFMYFHKLDASAWVRKRGSLPRVLESARLAPEGGRVEASYLPLRGTPGLLCFILLETRCAFLKNRLETIFVEAHWGPGIIRWSLGDKIKAAVISCCLKLSGILTPRLETWWLLRDLEWSGLRPGTIKASLKAMGRNLAPPPWVLTMPQISRKWLQTRACALEK